MRGAQSQNRDPLEVSTLRALSSALMLSPSDAARRLDESGVARDDFASPECVTLFDTLAVLAREGREIDAVALAHTLRGQVARELVIAVATASDFGALSERARALRDAAMRRRVLQALGSASALLRNPDASLEQAIAEATKALESVRSTTATRLDGSADLMSLLDRLDQVQAGKRSPVLATGIPALDAVVGGLQPTLTVLGAMPGVGKSALVASIVRNLTSRGVRVGVFSLEDEGGWLADRLTAEAARVPLFVLGNKPLTQAQMARVAEVSEGLHAQLRHLVRDDRSGLTTADIVASAREMLIRDRVQALLVDHLGEIRLSRSDRHDLDVTDALQQLRALSKAYSVPVLVACHVRRRDGLSQRDEPRLTDFAFSAGVERMARVALALSRPDENTLRVHVLKQTKGQSGVAVDLPFLGPVGLVGQGSDDGLDAYASQERQLLEGAQ